MLDVIDSPAAWCGPELLAHEAWGRRLSPAEIGALERAAREVDDAPCPGFSATSFRVPELGRLLAWMAQQLEQGPGVVRLSGLPVGRMDRGTVQRVFWGLCVNLGTPIFQTSAGEVLGEVRDETGTGAALSYDSGTNGLLSARTIARSTGALRFHTDKCDLLALLCASNGIAGGESKLVSSVAIHNEIARRRPDLLRVLYEPFWRMRPSDEEGDRPDRVFSMPVFARGPDGAFTSQYSRTYINQATEVAGVPPLTDAQNAAMDLLHAVGEELCLYAAFEPGDMQFMTQHVTYHGRTAFTDNRDAGAVRVLMRIWLSAPFSRALPTGHAVQWGDTRAGALRGGALVGRSAIAA